MKWINNFPNKYKGKTLIQVITKKWQYASSMTLSTLWYYDFDLSNKYIYTEFSEKKCFLPPDKYTHVCVSGGKKYKFFGKVCVYTTWMIPKYKLQ